jgi:hypothetical protein
MIARRHVFHVAGYDPYDVAGQHRRFRRELAKFAQTWGLSASASDVTQDRNRASWSVTTRGPNWTVETTFEPLDWHDIVRADLAKPAIPRLVAGAATCWDIIATGTFRRYFVASHRYAFFFLVPFVDVLLFALIGAIAGYELAGALPLAGPLGPLGPLGPSGSLRAAAATAIAAAVFALLMRWPGRRWRVAQGLADWIFARDYMLGRRPDVAARLDSFASRMLACARASEVDEIVVVGHSLGASLVIDALTQALAHDPDLGRRGPAVALLTIGATIPKIALHPLGARLRACAERVAYEPSVFWVEYQSRDDAISFYKFHPVTLREVAPEGDTVQPVVRRVQLHEMMSAQDFRRHRFDFMRLHYQFVMANALRAAYDYFMIVCGPLSLKEIALAPGGPGDAIAPDGALIRPAPAPASV